MFLPQLLRRDRHTIKRRLLKLNLLIRKIRGPGPHVIVLHQIRAKTHVDTFAFANFNRTWKRKKSVAVDQFRSARPICETYTISQLCIEPYSKTMCDTGSRNAPRNLSEHIRYIDRVIVQCGPTNRFSQQLIGFDPCLAPPVSNLLEPR